MKNADANNSSKRELNIGAQIVTVSIESIKPSPENDDIYGAMDPTDHELIMLSNDILANGLREPITVSKDDYVISGHRRLAAAKIARLQVIPIRRMDVLWCEFSDVEWKQLLASHNRQRVKTGAMRMREAFLATDPELAHRQLLEAREERDRESPEAIELGKGASRSRISDQKLGMLTAANLVISQLKKFWPLTVRQVHYRLLNNPPLRHSAKPDSIYRNDRKSYSDLCDLLTRARLDGSTDWNAIVDETRPVSNLGYALDAAAFIDRTMHWFLKGYRRDLQLSQLDHFEIVAEKLTVQGILKPIADRYCIPMTIARGYCSLSPRQAIAKRFKQSGKDRLTLLIASDLDPDGDEIAESFARSLRDDFGTDPRCIKVFLTMEQVQEWDLPDNGMEAKQTSSRYRTYFEKYETDKVFELEAIEPSKMQAALVDAIERVIDMPAFNAELMQEKQDAVRLSAVRSAVTEFVKELVIDDE